MNTVLSDRTTSESTVSAPTRIAAFDWTKGALVLLMLFYHWLSYFLATEGLFYRYLRFVTPSFIFLTGFLISNVHFAKYGFGNPQLARRLAIRGLKILGLFVFLNLLVTALLRDSYSGKIVFGSSLSTLTSIFVTGNVLVVGGKAAVFYILVPISYVLLMSSLLVILAQHYKHALRLACVCSLLSALIVQLLGRQCANLELIAVGLLGVCCGEVPLQTIKSIVAHPYELFAAYCGYVFAITVWDVLYPLLIVGVGLSLMLLFLISTRAGTSGFAHRHFILLGKYSLFGYIAQIAVLQALYRGFRLVGPVPGTLVLSFCAAFTLTVAGVVWMDRARARLPVADRLYKAVFS